MNKTLSNIVTLWDPGHGQYNGNQSPDGSVVEWSYCRELVALIVAGLREEGIEAHILVPEIANISLSERVRRVNAWCKKVGTQNVALISVHLNAAGNGKVWRSARGFLPFIDPNAGAGSKRLARYLYEEAEKNGLKGNRWISSNKYATKYLTMTHNTWCTAVLTENLFQDNKDDVAILLSEEGKRKIVETHIEAVRRWCNG